jgi:CspA family cold shock protein
MKGTIARWFDFRGFGFIEVEGQEHDIFVHSSNFNGFVVPKVGDVVDFDVQDSPKGLRAVNVEISEAT